jgi:hypothetical protein
MMTRTTAVHRPDLRATGAALEILIAKSEQGQSAACPLVEALSDA